MILYDNIQNFFKSAGKNACYVFCLLAIAEKERPSPEISVLDALNTGIVSGAFHFNKLDYLDENNFYVTNPCKLLEALTSKEWEMEFTDNPQKAFHGPKYAVHKYVYKDALGTRSHFITSWFDPAPGSLSVTQGKWESARLFSVKGE